MATLRPFQEVVAELRAGLRCLDAAASIEEIATAGGTLVDVRESAESTAQPAPHSVNIPRGVLEMKIVELTDDPEHPLYLHCASGGRATLSADALTRLGYARVTVITSPLADVLEQQRRLDQR